jgi:hypothetical protein
MTINGITFTVNDDGTIVANGTASANAPFSLIALNKTTIPKGAYFISGCPSGAGFSTYYMSINFYNDSTYVVGINDVGEGRPIDVSDKTYTSITMTITIISGTVCNNVVFKPMLNEGTTALPYEPFFKGLRDTKVTSLESRGAQLIKYPYTHTTATRNGITFTDNGNETITVSGTSTGSAEFIVKRISLEAGTYTYNVGSNLKTGIIAWVQYSHKETNAWAKNVKMCSYNSLSATFAITAEEAELYNVTLTLYVETTGVTFDNVVFYPMLNYGTEAAPFKPYKGDALGTLAIPEAVQSLEGYGRGVNETYRNSIEWRDGRCYFIKRTARKIFDGTEMWGAYAPEGWAENNANGKYCYYVTFDESKRVGFQTSVCNMFNNADCAWDETTTKCVVGNYSDHSRLTNCYFVTTHPTIAEWRAHLAELYASGNPLVIEYALAEPIETDITDILKDSNIIKVEGGGTITAHNEYENGAPSTIKYTAKVGS